MTAGGLLERAEVLGVRVVQFADNLALHRLADTDLAALRRSAERRRIDVEIGTCGIDSVNLDSYLRLAEFFRSPIVRVVLDTPNHRPTPDEVVATLRRALPAFERAGVCLAIENHDRLPSTTLAAILDRLDSPCAGICLDTANSLGCLEGLETVLEVLGPRAVNLHIKDFEIVRPPHQKGFIIEGRPAEDGSTYPGCWPGCGQWGATPTRSWNSGRPPNPTPSRPRPGRRPGPSRASGICASSSPRKPIVIPLLRHRSPAPALHGPEDGDASRQTTERISYFATAATMAANGVSTGPMGCGP
jgi:sugar phosphate isomerase/epimerase